MSRFTVQDSELQFLDVGTGDDRRAIAVRHRPGAGPTVVWFGGFRSDMDSTKAAALDAWGERSGRAVLRFDYSGHGRSGGRFEDGTISRWLEDAQAMLAARGGDRPVVVGSSMGGWIALLAARAAAARGQALGGLVLIAPAVDFTEALMWKALPDAVRAVIMEEGVWHRPSAYSDQPYPITRALIEDGRRHLMLDGPPIVAGCPVHVLQGMQDPDVPWRHAMEVVEHMPGDDVVTTLIRDGDHRLSRAEDIERLIAAVEGLSS
jgi:pimeloyl-ACP methyl ester carboxylesterase